MYPRLHIVVVEVTHILISTTSRNAKIHGGVPDLAPGQIRRPPPPCPVSHSHSHVLRYPHANFQHPSMSLGWIFILAPWSAPLTFFAKRNRRLSFPCSPPPPPLQPSLLPWACPLSALNGQHSPFPATFGMDLRLTCA